MTMNGLSSIPNAAPASSGLLESLTGVARATRALLAGVGRRFRGPMTIVHLSGRRGDGPPDLDELWSDFNRKLSGLFGRGTPPGPGRDPSGPPPDMKSAGLGLGVVGAVAVLIWGCTGVFIVNEGEQAVVLSFGKYTKTVHAGMQYRLPYPFQSHEIVQVSLLQTANIGGNAVAQYTGLRDSFMLTKDENIVDIRFSVQYRIKPGEHGIENYLFKNRQPDSAVSQAAESAVREIVGAKTMDEVLYEKRQDLQPMLIKSVQAQLDRVESGILIENVNVQSVQAPEQVQAAFDDAFKAGADSERLKNEGQAYANTVIPEARGAAARLLEEARAYQARVEEQAKGDSLRFASVLAEYQKAPAVTRDRLYIDAMQQIYSNVSKVLVDSRGNSNLLYLPLDKLIQQTAPAAAPSPAVRAPEPAAQASAATDTRSRDNQRTRDRDIR